MSEGATLTLAEIVRLATAALCAAGASRGNVMAVAAAIAAAERDGVASHGLSYLATYCDHLRCGKVDGRAQPELSKPGLIVVDAHAGFAHPAISLGLETIIPLARSQGIAALAVRNSYNCGVLAYHTEQIAAHCLLGLGITHVPASIAPAGGLRPVVGTNPIALAVPDGNGGCSISIDQSASVVAKSEIIKRHREGRPIPAGWAFGPNGERLPIRAWRYRVRWRQRAVIRGSAWHYSWRCLRRPPPAPLCHSTPVRFRERPADRREPDNFSSRSASAIVRTANLPAVSIDWHQPLPTNPGRICSAAGASRSGVRRPWVSV